MRLKQPERHSSVSSLWGGKQTEAKLSVIFENSGIKRILKDFALSSGLTVALEKIRPSVDDQGPACARMLRMGMKPHRECQGRRVLLMRRVAATLGPASVKCPFGIFCMAVPLFLNGCHVGTLRAGGFSRRAEASSSRASAIQEILRLIADEVERRALSLTFRRTTDDLINRVLVRIHAHFLESICLSQIAREEGLSRQCLGRLWKKKLGVSFNGYLHGLRIEHACNLLRENEKKIIDVAFESGFGSVSQFNRVFLQVQGISPREFVVRSRNGEATKGEYHH